MADIPTLEAAPDGTAAAKPAGRRSWLAFTIIMLLIFGGGGAAAWYFMMASGDKPTHVKKAAPPAGPPMYVALDPPFVVNFEAEQLVRFLQITVQVMSRDAQVVDLIKANDPVIRNDLLLLFGNQTYAVIATREGKEQLRKQALNAVRNVIKSAGGKAELVEAVYFTSFVMQ
jgi:flagellar FliL protein